MKNTFILYNDKLEPIKEKHYACGSCGKKRRKTAKEPWTMVNSHGKIIWKNAAYKALELTL